jgi:hypothetical protein
MLSGMCYPTGKQTHTGRGMGKNLYPHAGMGFLSGRIRVGGRRYVTTLPDRFLHVAISNADAHNTQTLPLWASVKDWAPEDLEILEVTTGASSSTERRLPLNA